MNEVNEKTAAQIEHELAQFVCTEHYYRANHSFVYTDGVKYLAEATCCYWLLDEISLSQPRIKEMKDEKLQHFQFWTLTSENNKGCLICERDSGDIVLKHDYVYTDFPLKKVKLWLINIFQFWNSQGQYRGNKPSNYGTLILPSEY